MTLHQSLKLANVPTDNWQSDLYAQVCDESKELISRYEFKNNVTVFTSHTDGKLWYSIPFAYDPFWPDA